MFPTHPDQNSPPLSSHLPPELLVKIFSYLLETPASSFNSPSRSHSLAQLSQCCHTFQSIAQPLLYRSLDVRTRRAATSLYDSFKANRGLVEGIRELRLRTEQVLGPPNQMETTELMERMNRLRKLRAEQRWFGIETLEGVDNLTHLALIGACTPSLALNTSLPPLANLRHLSITLHGLYELLLLASRRIGHRNDVLLSITTLSVHVASGTLPSFLPPRNIAAPLPPLLDFLPSLSTLSTPLQYSIDIPTLLQRSPDPGKISILWRTHWQAFVDFLPPHRDFGNWNEAAQDDDLNEMEAARPIHQQLVHLAFAPFSYPNIPDHFLLELTSRMRYDPSLRQVKSVWLDVGWEIVGTEEGKRDWREIVEERGIKVGFIDMKCQAFLGWEGSAEETFAEWKSRVEE